MHFKSIILLVLLIPISQSISSQDFVGEEKKVYDVIIKLFDGMRAGDSSMVHSVFFDDCRMYSNFINPEGKNENKTGSLQSFLNAIGTPHDDVWDEKIWNTTVTVEMGIAQVWTEYAFYVGTKFSHCGIDAFQLMKEGKEWKIIQIIDTRKTEGCDLSKG